MAAYGLAAAIPHRGDTGHRLVRWSLVLMLLLGLERGAECCSCGGDPEPNDALGQAAAVFLGSIIEVHEVSAGMVVLKFSVEKAWKGVHDRTVEVQTTTTCCICGYGFRGAPRHLIYADSRPGKLVVSECSRSRSMPGAVVDLMTLGPPERVYEQREHIYLRARGERALDCATLEVRRQDDGGLLRVHLDGIACAPDPARAREALAFTRRWTEGQELIIEPISQLSESAITAHVYTTAEFSLGWQLVWVQTAVWDDEPTPGSLRRWIQDDGAAALRERERMDAPTPPAR